MNSPVKKHSIVINGHRTSVSLEEPFWNALREIAVHRGTNLSELVRGIDDRRNHSNLSSAIRLFVLGVYQNEITSQLHPQATSGEMVV